MIALVLLLACADAPEPRQLTVLAASSLTDAYSELERHVELNHEGTEVTVSFAGSQTVATWVREGVQADIVATADRQTLAALHADGLVGPPRLVATNRLVLVQPRDAPPLALADLAQAERIVLGAPEVPAGHYADAALSVLGAAYGAEWLADVQAHVVSREPNVRQVAAKVALGEADAALVYATDADAVEGLRAVSLPADLSVATGVYQAALTTPEHPETAAQWTELVSGAHGQRVLAGHGFGPPVLPSAP